MPIGVLSSYIFASYLLKRKKNADFRIISVTIFCSKDIIHTYI